MGSLKYNNECKFFGFYSCVIEVFVLVGCDTTSEGNWYPTFQDSVVVLLQVLECPRRCRGRGYTIP